MLKWLLCKLKMMFLFPRTIKNETVLVALLKDVFKSNQYF